MTRITLILLTGVAAATLSACGRDWASDGEPMRPMRAVTQLQCPDHEGSLTRVRVAADGLSCDYAGSRGAEVVLKLVKPANGDSAAALDDLDSQMNALMPEVQGKVEQGEAEMKAEDSAPSSPGSSTGSRDRADIDLPGFHIHTHGDHAEVRLPGVSVDADDDKHGGGSSHGNAHVSVAGGLVDVRAHNDAAIVHVRSRGAGVRAGYRLADKTPSPDGWRLVGYDAHGPAGGPLVVAIVKSKDSEENPLFHDAMLLVRTNVGG